MRDKEQAERAASGQRDKRERERHTHREWNCSGEALNSN